ncbi:hypothetical protein [Streptomyces heilongjiangensis]|uniref:Uncharacterized protein n=1 Tax=Streptomyces heilongjiangensis TaxID=945052 RepID=A0ABW1BIT2_9ACTN|nr:hypothetical protein [Streptomyces heilongjiangensis]MDC2952108.1 hypothetical protein [Streptomyces heilongjiangensis]
MAHEYTTPVSDGGDAALVVMQATAEVAEAAHALGRPAIFVQQPGGPVEELLDDHALLHSLDFTDDTFADFVGRVLQPLAPRAVVTLDESARASADRANEILGVPRTTADEIRARLRAAVGELPGREAGQGTPEEVKP